MTMGKLSYDAKIMLIGKIDSLRRGLNGARGEDSAEAQDAGRELFRLMWNNVWADELGLPAEAAPAVLNFTDEYADLRLVALYPDGARRQRELSDECDRLLSVLVDTEAALTQACQCANEALNRLETIADTHPTISLKADISRWRKVVPSDWREVAARKIRPV